MGDYVCHVGSNLSCLYVDTEREDISDIVRLVLKTRELCFDIEVFEPLSGH